MKAPVAYFSPTGTSKGKSMELAADIGGDLFGTRPVQAYSAADLDWTNPHSRSSMEMKGNFSVIPEPAETADLHEYDTLFVGYPIWWNRAPRISADNRYIPEDGRSASRGSHPFCHIRWIRYLQLTARA